MNEKKALGERCVKLLEREIEKHEDYINLAKSLHRLVDKNKSKYPSNVQTPSMASVWLDIAKIGNRVENEFSGNWKEFFKNFKDPNKLYTAARQFQSGEKKSEYFKKVIDGLLDYSEEKEYKNTKNVATNFSYIFKLYSESLRSLVDPDDDIESSSEKNTQLSYVRTGDRGVVKKWIDLFKDLVGKDGALVEAAKLCNKTFEKWKEARENRLLFYMRDIYTENPKENEDEFIEYLDLPEDDLIFERGLVCVLWVLGYRNELDDNILEQLLEEDSLRTKRVFCFIGKVNFDYSDILFRYDALHLKAQNIDDFYNLISRAGGKKKEAFFEKIIENIKDSTVVSWHMEKARRKKDGPTYVVETNDELPYWFVIPPII